MELKSGRNTSPLRFFRAFNRTAYGIEMALGTEKQRKEALLLIAPLMELKLRIAFSTIRRSIF